MRSIGARLALWYTLAATVAFAGLSVAGYFMLERHLIHGLDLLNAAEFEQIKAHLGPDYQNLSPRVIDERIRETTELASVLFFIEIDRPHFGTVFSSRNLKTNLIPDLPGQHLYSIEAPRVSPLRVAEFVLLPS